ncbi:MAG: metal-dependent transcriptional regulator [Dehalococcoidia bacterium]|nr:metal-dependent transcriptional regulator [Dehalococcoidia bacterium]MDZ4245691.1 metal-dependent transcriptional regulator [Dehalococcoidia bacterium]
MDLEEKTEELLETIWVSIKEQDRDNVQQDEVCTGATEELEKLVTAGYVTVSNGQLSLTPRGEPLARNVIRRHRLAERLLADVLNTGDSIMHEKACKFEHLLDRGLDDSICTLLGHPKICPHGKPIPPGRCCQKQRAPVSSLVSPLSRLNPGQKGKVAYVHAPQIKQLQKLMAMGILPGAPITLIQDFPSYVFQVGQTQFAVDNEIADAIYVRLLQNEETADAEVTSPPPKTVGGRWGWRRK